MKTSFTKMYKSLTLAGCLVASVATSSVASNVEKIHFLIPGGAWVVAGMELIEVQVKL